VNTIEPVTWIIAAQIQNLRGIITGLNFGVDTAFVVKPVVAAEICMNPVSLRKNDNAGSEIFAYFEFKYSQRVINFYAGAFKLDYSAEF
jgi:hypothetical protein